MNTNTLLIVEEDPDVREFLVVALGGEAVQIGFVSQMQTAVDRVVSGQCKPDLILIDALNGVEAAVHAVRRVCPELPIVVMASKWDKEAVQAAVQAGVNHILWKPLVYADLTGTVGKLLQITSPPALVGSEAGDVRSVANHPAPSMWNQRVTQILESMRHSDVPVLLQGETGVGKEVLARQVHDTSQRAKKPFLKLNCAALPPDLIESELFGYERGAFTGAFKSTPGKFELANGGTILLDEIGDMDVKLQAKLLQVLQDREFLRLGARETSQVDVRVIAATHRNLEESIENGQFREDLYYRLNVITITIPALRERRDEILSIAEFLLSRHAQPGQPMLEIGPALQQALLNHDWPGNIRELENTMRRYLVICNEKVIIEELENKVRRKSKRVVAAAAGQTGNSALPPSSFSSTTSDFSVQWPSAKAFEVAEPQFSLARESAAVRVAEPVVVPDVPHVPAAGLAAAASFTPVPPVKEEGSLLSQVDDARKQAEIRVIVNTLNATLWNRKQAARLLQLDYKALLYKMKKLHIGEQSQHEQTDDTQKSAAAAAGAGALSMDRDMH